MISKEFSEHVQISQRFDKQTNSVSIIAIHRRHNNMPSFGATRIIDYKNIDLAVDDACRLSRLMSYKSALAGLTCGGAKSVIMSAVRKSTDRNKVLQMHADHVNSLSGRFITGADVGLHIPDVKYMSKLSKYFVGTKYDPVFFTVHGILNSLEVCAKHIGLSSDLSGATFAIQGVGKVGSGLIKNLYKKAKKIYVSDTDRLALNNLKKKYSRVVIISNDEISKQKVNFFAPCALSGAINSDNITQIQADVICGGANNQLKMQDLGNKLHRAGILYAPDYVVNSGGLVSVVDEYYHARTNNQRVLTKINSNRVKLDRIITLSKKNGTPTNVVADHMAEQIFNQY